MSRSPERFTVSGGFFLLLLLFLLESDGLLVFAILSAAALHELGHLAVLALCGGKVRALHISAFGARLQLAERNALSYQRELFAVLAGPAANLLSAFLLARVARVWELGYLFAGTHLLLGLFNLLPIVPLDGGRALYLAVAYLTNPQAGERVTAVAGGLLLAAFSAGICFVIWQTGGNFHLLLGSLGLTVAFLRTKRQGLYL